MYLRLTITRNRKLGWTSKRLDEYFGFGRLDCTSTVWTNTVETKLDVTVSHCLRTETDCGRTSTSKFEFRRLIPRHRRKRNNPLAIPRQIIALNFTARLNCAVQQHSVINIFGDKRMTSLRRVNRRATLSAEQSAPTTEA